jgi:hypothetical protein
MSDWDSPRAFLLRAGNALLRLVVVAILGIAHWLLEEGILYVLPGNLNPCRLWVQDVFFCVFMLVYVYLLWDMVKVFIPRLQAEIYPGQEVADEKE